MASTERGNFSFEEAKPLKRWENCRDQENIFQKNIINLAWTKIEDQLVWGENLSKANRDNWFIVENREKYRKSSSRKRGDEEVDGNFGHIERKI